MLTHASPEAVRPPRVVILGATGVIGRALALYLKDRDETTGLIGSRDLDLLRDDAPEQLAARLRPDDAVVMLSCIPPRRGRDLATMVQNVQMGMHVCAALSRQPVAHVLYLSSDSVYPRSVEEVTESSPTEPSDPYSAMHIIRERMFRGFLSTPVAILRTTQVSAFDDTHDAYGPNRFRRTARQEGRIVLFGRGEETRDHIMANDVASLIHLCLMHRSHGVMNVATGRSLSFAEVANIVSAGFEPAPMIEHAPRQIPITHRRFDISACARAFPGFTFTSFESGEAEIRRLLQPYPAVR